MIFCETVCHLGIPVVEPAAEMLKKDDWRLIAGAELSVGVSHAGNFDKLGFCGVVRGGHDMPSRGDGWCIGFEFERTERRAILETSGCLRDPILAPLTPSA